MIKKEQIESILKINGVEPTSPDEEIRSVLLSARYHKEEVDTAIMILRENTRTNKTRVDGLHKVFRTDESLSPEEISQLLGIEIDLSDRVAHTTGKTRNFSKLQFTLVWILSFILALVGLLFYMYVYNLGVFHPSTGIAL